jgi:Leucine-rich repeat (LRR) protein
MSYNLVQSLPRSGFAGLSSLETVDLSFNDLREVDDRAFDDLPWLSTLRVS